MGRGITLKGEAARIFVEGAMDKKLTSTKRKPKPLTTADKYLYIATKVTLLIKSGAKAEADVAVSLLAFLDEQGLETTYDLAKAV